MNVYFIFWFIIQYWASQAAPGALPARRPPSPRAPGEPRPHARFQESLWDLAPAAR